MMNINAPAADQRPQDREENEHEIAKALAGASLPHGDPYRMLFTALGAIGHLLLLDMDETHPFRLLPGERARLKLIYQELVEEDALKIPW